MGERRPLVAGVRPAGDPDRAREHEFVYAGAGAEARPPVAARVGREPLTTRLRADYARALKRASLERELAGVDPHTVQELLEEALGPWLRAHGYLP